MYADEDVDTPLKDVSLDFNSSLKVVTARDKRLFVRRPDSNDALGWIERSDLLCSVTPLISESGLEQKFYAFTKADELGNPPQTGHVYTVPETNSIDGDIAALDRLKTFYGYTVFDRDTDAGTYLLAEVQQIDEVSNLLGWFPAKDGVLWDSAYGLRPASERTICAYLSLEDARQQRHCQPIQGGARWYRFQERLPLLDRVEDNGKPLYRVLLSFYQIVMPFERLYQHVSVGYIPVSDEIAEDVYLTSSEMEKWKDLLQLFDALETVSRTELRTAFVNGFTNSIERIFRKALYGNTHVPLSEFLQQACGLVVRQDSPLFCYSIDNLSDPLVVPDCELTRLRLWGKAHADMLEIVSYGTKRPEYEYEKLSETCPSADHIPIVSGEIEAHPLGDADMRYDHRFQGSHIYWVPKEFLP
ncbi:hypothetical protein CSA57_11195 [candidate division KSB3 bacterium]|nr:MAG: hypothetical protein CSA57_11195 [candidate division KSB3 bacterium]